MEDRTINQNGVTPIYIEKNSGKIYIGNLYVEEPSVAFVKGSYELQDYAPTIQPSIHREEVDQIKDWIERRISTEHPYRLAYFMGRLVLGSL